VVIVLVFTNRSSLVGFLSFPKSQIQTRDRSRVSAVYLSVPILYKWSKTETNTLVISNLIFSNLIAYVPVLATRNALGCMEVTVPSWLSQRIRAIAICINVKKQFKNVRKELSK